MTTSQVQNNSGLRVFCVFIFNFPKRNNNHLGKDLISINCAEIKKEPAQKPQNKNERRFNFMEVQ